MAEPTYIFKDGHVYTMEEGKVVASVKESDFAPPVNGQVEMPEAPAELQGTTCPTCGQQTQPQDSYCPACGTPLTAGVEGEESPYGESANVEAPMAGTAIAQTVTTPNGLKGRVLARVPALWGEEVTVRFENGVIKKIPVDKRLTFAAAEEAPEGQTSVERLDERLAASYQSDEDSLRARAAELGKLAAEAAQSVGGASDEEARHFDRLAVQAGYELKEIASVLEQIEATRGEGFEAPAPIENTPAVIQASTGSSKANWLDRTVGEMVAEASTLDYEKLMDEGPEAFVAGLDKAALADSGTTRVMAAREIRSHTAGADETKRDGYERVWLARVEEQRQAQLTAFKDEVRKEASSEDVNAPDESLFL